MKKRNIIPIAVVLLLIAVSFIPVFIRKNSFLKHDSLSLRIYLNGEIYQECPVENGKEIVIEQKNGEKNVIHMTENGFFMQSSTCKNQLCVHQGEVNSENFSGRTLGTHILCLPHRLDAELIVSSSQNENVPDVWQ